MATHSIYDQKTDLVAISVKINGSAISDKVQIDTLSVYKSLYKISTAKVEILDGNISDAEFETIENENYEHGAEVEIATGYHDQTEVIFKGIIVKHSIKISSNKSSKVILECADKAIELTGQRKFEYFSDKKDSDIIQQLITIQKDVDATDKIHERVIQHNVSDWDFIITRAQANKMVVLSDEGKISVKKPTTGESVADLVYGENIIDLDVSIDARTQVQELQTQSWDPKVQEIVTSVGAEPEEVDKLGDRKGKKMAGDLNYIKTELHSTANMDTEELQQWADGSVLLSRLSRVRGIIKTQGIKVNPMDTVKLSSLGKYYDGEAYVSGVYHEQKEGNWVTEIELGISPDLFVKQKDDINLPVADGLFPGVHGLFIGKVVQIDNDPLGEYRIKVVIPMVKGTDGDGVWCRVSNIMAGNKFGAFFYPEIDDEVVCGTLGGDLRFPVVLGYLYSSQKYKTPESNTQYSGTFKNTEENHHKGILTRENLMLHFDDDKKVIRIETPDGRRIEMNDDSKEIIIEDSFNNKLVMDNDGFKFTGDKKFVVDVRGEVNISSSMAAVNIKSGPMAALKAEGGSSFEVKNSTGAKVTGGMAGATLDSSGMTKVKGSIVMIN